MMTQQNNSNNNSKGSPSSFDSEHVSADSVYEFYKQELYPAIIASLPILWDRLTADSIVWFKLISRRILEFLLPAIFWSQQQQQDEEQLLQHNADKWSIPSNLIQLWEQAIERSSKHSTLADFMLRQFDTNGDGHISSSELINMTEIVSKLQQQLQQHHYHPQFLHQSSHHQQPVEDKHKIQVLIQSIVTWFSREWPLMDWKLGLFLWRSFGGLLIVLAIFSIVPGRLHRTAGKIMRWPILGMTYFLITVELTVYVVIRSAIVVAEVIIATPKHRTLRRKMKYAKSYKEWYKYASELDNSQKRDQWQRTVDDKTSYRYNWAFIRQLMKDMRMARSKDDSLLALAVLQQCTRKNVGGVMSEDLFSYTNTGDPKHIVTDFVVEVTRTLRWITDEAIRIPQHKNIGEDEIQAKLSYEQRLDRQVKKEKDKLWKSLMSWATLTFDTSSSSSGGLDNSIRRSSSVGSTGSNNNQQQHVPKIETVLSQGEFSTISDTGSEAIPRTLPSFHKKQLIAFLKRARAAYGRTALCLSGGAMMGLYHFGHIVGLVETRCLPHIVSGTSAGSVVGALLCTRTDEELKRDLTPEALDNRLLCFSRPWLDRMKSVWKNGHMFDFDEWLLMIRWFTCGDMTFEEAYHKTGRIFCITLSSTTKKAPPVLLNYISAPTVTIASAVIASAAVPGFVPPVRLQYKDSDGTVKTKGGPKDETYFDGSIEQDIPVNGLAEMLNCQFFVACQCNPHVVPFFFNSKGGVGRPSRWSSGKQEDSWRGGFLLAALEMYLKNDMKAKFHFLNDLEAAVGFTSTMMTQTFEGSTTIVPEVRFSDYFKLFSNPNQKDLYRYFQAGAVAAYQHASMIRLHYRIADALDECLERLENGKVDPKPSRISLSEQPKQIVLDGLSDFMPALITAALNERIDNSSSNSNDHHERTSDSTSMTEDSQSS